MEEGIDPAEKEVEGGIDSVAAEQADTHPAEKEEVEEGIDPVAAEQADTHPVVG